MTKHNRFEIFNELIDKAKKINNARIVLPEGDDERIIWTANKIANDKMCKIILIGDKSKILPKLSETAKKAVSIVDPLTSNKKNHYAQVFYELRKHKGITVDIAQKYMSNNIYFATMMVHLGDADGLVAGCKNQTSEVLRPAFQIIKTKAGFSKASSCMILESPDKNKYGENGFVVMGDCAVNEKPTAEELADIAISSSKTASVICGMTPRVAMLSYSSLSKEDVSQQSEDIKKVKQACEILKNKAPNLLFEGELQADAALEPVVAQIKTPNSKILGNANVLIFPDLNAGNIGYKMASIFGGLKAVGPIIQGLNKPINDLSRSAKEEEIYLTVAITVLQTQE